MPTDRLKLPAAVGRMADRGPDWAAWVEALPGTVTDLLGEWSLRRDGAPRHGRCSLVLPVRTASGRPAVLKVGWSDEHTDREHLALRHWAGRGAVRLLQADPHRQALLLERLHDEDLTTCGYVEAAEIVGDLATALHVPAPPTVRRLSDRLAVWRRHLAAVPDGAHLPRRYLLQARSLLEAFAAAGDVDGTLLHGDLHDENVLAAERGPWLAIDPQPLSGDPHYEPAPLLWNRWHEAVATGDVRRAVRSRFHAAVDAAGLDENRARDWTVLRVVLNFVWELHEPVPDQEFMTVNIAVAKAVQG